MDNAVTGIHHAEVRQSKVTSIASQSIYLRPRHSILDRFVLIMRRSVVIRHTINMVGPETLDTALAQSFKSLRAGHLVAIEAVNIELYRAILHLLNHVGVPNLVK